MTTPSPAADRKSDATATAIREYITGKTQVCSSSSSHSPKNDVSALVVQTLLLRSYLEQVQHLAKGPQFAILFLDEDGEDVHRGLARAVEEAQTMLNLFHAELERRGANLAQVGPNVCASLMGHGHDLRRQLCSNSFGCGAV